MSHPRLTVILPAQNAEATLGAAIQSVLYQTYGDFELWVLENGSQDRTVEVARSFGDPRVRVFELGPVGFQGALTYGLEHAQTEWLARMDADDLSFPERFEKQVEVIEMRPDLVMVGTQRAWLTPFGHIFEPVQKGDSREVKRLSLRVKGSNHKFFVDASVIFNRAKALEVGGYDPEFRTGDVPLWFRLLSRGRGWEIAQPLYLYRLVPGSMGYTRSKSYAQSHRLLEKYAPELLHQLSGSQGTMTDDPSRFDEIESRHKKQQWLLIVVLELLSGDRRSAHQAIRFLENDKSLIRKAKLARVLCNLGRVGSLYYRWRKRYSYRHRPDWERRFTELVGSLSIAAELLSDNS